MILGRRNVLPKRVGAARSPLSVALPHIALVLGGARSGKSRYAETLVEAMGGGVYLATAAALDAEMAERIRRHRERRGKSWTTLEEPLEIARALTAVAADRPVLVDCLTLWLSNLIAAGRDVERETDALIDALAHRDTPVIVVANEVGLGIVPENALARALSRSRRAPQSTHRRARRPRRVHGGRPAAAAEGTTRA